MKGRCQKPPALKAIHGKKKPKVINVAPATSFPCPEHLEGDAEQHWERFAPGLIEHGLLVNGLDEANFEAMCVAYSLMKQAERLLLEEGLTIRSGRDRTRKKHPAHTIFKVNSELYRKYAEMFGMSPMARARIGLKLDQEAKNDPMEKFLKRKPE